jgi:hypothetical protein
MSRDRRIASAERRPRRRLAARLAVAAVVAVLTVVAAPGIASAATGSVTPLLDCVNDNDNGTYTAVLGYSNTTGRTQVIPLGWNNMVSPSKFNGTQPTTFQNGTFHGAFSVTFTTSERFFSPLSWTLNGTTVGGSYYMFMNACPAGTTMPSSGNGTGPAIALLAAGVIGVLLVRRFVRRSTRVAPAGVPAAPETVDA